MADPLPPEYAALLPNASDTIYAEREKSALARMIARECLKVGNGQGLGACLSVLVLIATDTTNGVRVRTRALCAKAVVELSLKAAASGVRVAIQNNMGVAAPIGPPREFWQATLADPEGRKMALAELSKALGVAAPLPVAPPPAPAVVIEAQSAPPRRTKKAGGA